MSLWQKLFGGGKSEPADHEVAGGHRGGEFTEREPPYGISSMADARGRGPRIPCSRPGSVPTPVR